MIKVLFSGLLLVMSCPVFGDDLAVPPAFQTAPTSTPVQISREEKAKIFSDFKKKISEEEKRFDQNEKTMRREFQKSQADHRKQWREREKKARRIFFEAHQSGPERRAYVQNYVKNTKAYDQNEKKEWIDFKNAQKAKRESFRISQKQQSDRVNAALDQNLRPEF